MIAGGCSSPTTLICCQVLLRVAANLQLQQAVHAQLGSNILLLCL